MTNLYADFDFWFEEKKKEEWLVVFNGRKELFRKIRNGEVDKDSLEIKLATIEFGIHLDNVSYKSLYYQRERKDIKIIEILPFDRFEEFQSFIKYKDIFSNIGDNYKEIISGNKNSGLIGFELKAFIQYCQELYEFENIEKFEEFKKYVWNKINIIIKQTNDSYNIREMDNLKEKFIIVLNRDGNKKLINTNRIIETSYKVKFLK